MNNIAVFISEGMGDALAMVPFLKKLKQRNARITGIFTSPYRCEELFRGTRLLDEIIVLSGNLAKRISMHLFWEKKFEITYLNTFVSGRKNILLALRIARKVITNRIPENLQLPIAWKRQIIFVPPMKNIHDAKQNLLLLNEHKESPALCEEDFLLDSLQAASSENESLRSFLISHRPYLAVQPSEMSPKTPYKSCAEGFWKKFLQRFSLRFPSMNVILLGGKEEETTAEKIMADNIPGVVSLAGKTSLREAAAVLFHSKIFLGIDSGLMHMSAALGKPTFVVWGGSDYRIFGYEFINPVRHKILADTPYCWPCYSWISPNTSRVNDPKDCPDFKCIRELAPERALVEFENFAKPLGL